jgi:hypothetical protein
MLMGSLLVAGAALVAGTLGHAPRRRAVNAP